MVGYLAISIPFIAWAALKRMENFGTSVVGGLSGLQSAITSCNRFFSRRRRQYGQCRNGPDATRAEPHIGLYEYVRSDVTGNTVSSNALNGRTAVSLLRNQGFASRVVSMRVSEQDVTEANKQADAARSEAIAANTERSAVLADALTKGIAKYRSSRSSRGTSSSRFEQPGEKL